MKRIFTAVLLFLSVNAYSADSNDGKEYKVKHTIQNLKITGTSATSIDTDGGITADGALVSATLDTGQGANELYDMNQNVLQASAVTFATVDTGQGANELYDMNQNVQTTDNITHNRIIVTDTMTVQGSAFSVGGSTFVVTGGKVGIGTSSPGNILSFGGDAEQMISVDTTDGSDTMSLTLAGAADDTVSRGASIGIYGNERTNVGGSNYMVAGDVTTGHLRFHTGADVERMRITYSGNIGIGATAPATKLHMSSGTFFGDGNVSDIIMVGTPLDSTTHYMRLDTLAADTAGPPVATDCDASAEVGRMVLSSRYTATADNMIWVCLQTGASSYAWWKTALTAP